MRFAAPIFFANVSLLDDSIRAAVKAARAGAAGEGPPLKHFVLDLEGVTGPASDHSTA